MVDYTAENGWLCSTLRVQQLMQSVIQARWFDESEFMTLPFVHGGNIQVFYRSIDVPEPYPQLCLPVLQEITRYDYEILAKPLRSAFDESEIDQIYRIVQSLPEIQVRVSIQGQFMDDLEAVRPLDISSQPRCGPEDHKWLEIHSNTVRNSSTLYLFANSLQFHSNQFPFSIRNTC